MGKNSTNRSKVKRGNVKSVMRGGRPAWSTLTDLVASKEVLSSLELVRAPFQGVVDSSDTNDKDKQICESLLVQIDAATKKITDKIAEVKAFVALKPNKLVNDTEVDEYLSTMDDIYIVTTETAAVSEHLLKTLDNLSGGGASNE